MSLIAELQRRNVIRMAGLYLIGAWLIVQVTGTLLPMFEAPAWLARSVVVLLAVGFVPALAFSWVFELTPEGLKRDVEVSKEQSIAPQTARRMDRLIIVALALALGYFGFDKFVLAPRREAAALAAAASSMHANPLGLSGVSAKSVAVLPFVDMSQAQDQAYFSDGIAEELLNRLAQFSDLKVAARTSAFQFKGRNLDIADIGRQLKVSHVLEGSVRKDGARLRITAQLIDSTSGYHLWSQTFERDSTEVFKVQDEIASAIATALAAKLGGQPAAGTASRSVDPAAYDDYLQGRALFALRIDDNLKRAVEAFDRAIARDPGYGPAYSARAFALAVADEWEPWMPGEQALAQATASVEKALALDPDNAEALLVRGVIASARRETVAARADFERAHALAPGSEDVLNFYGDFLHFTGNLRGAERLKRQAMALDPLAFVHPGNLAGILSDQGRFGEALVMAERTEALRPGYGLHWMIYPQVQLGQLDAARGTTARLCAREADSVDCLFCNVLVLAASGRAGEARAAIAKFTAHGRVGRDAVQQGTGFAWLYASVLGDIPEATVALRAAMREPGDDILEPLLGGPHGPRLPEEISQDPQWLALWADPRLRELMEAYRANIAAFRKGD